MSDGVLQLDTLPPSVLYGYVHKGHGRRNPSGKPGREPRWPGLPPPSDSDGDTCVELVCYFLAIRTAC